MKIRWLILAALLTLLPGHANAQSEPISLPAYWEMMDSIQGGLETKKLQSEEDFSNLAVQLQSIQIVTLADGTEIQINHAYLVSLLQSDPPQINRVINILQAARAQRTLQIQQEFTKEDIAALSKILSQSEFQWQEESPNLLYDLWLRFTNWLLRLFSRLFPQLDNVNSIINAVLLVALGLVLSIIFWFIYRSVARSLVKEAELDPFKDEIHQLTSDQALVQAREKSTGGDQRNAVRYLYLSARLILIERGFITPDRTKTNNEILGELHSRPEISKRFAAITGIFDRAWYGYHMIDDETFEAYFQQVELLKNFREAAS